MLKFILQAILGLFLVRMQIQGTRADTYNVTVSINGINFGTFDAMEGGEADSEETVYYPGAMAAHYSLGGRQTITNVIVRRNYRLGRDHTESDRLQQWRGRVPMVVTKQPLDKEGHAWGKPIVYTGTMKRVAFPNHDSQSNDAGMLEVEMTTDTVVGMPHS